MRSGLSLGVHVGQQNATMAELVALWQRLDGVVDWISVWDHLYEAPPAGGQTPHFEAIATLGALASVTERARLGCLMFCVPYRNPALLAKACVAIDHISQGRFEPGFGAGWHAPACRARSPVRSRCGPAAAAAPERRRTRRSSARAGTFPTSVRPSSACSTIGSTRRARRSAVTRRRSNDRSTWRSM